jgi:hypothetical protein
MLILLCAIQTGPVQADRIDDLYIMAMEAEDNASSTDDYRQAVKLYRKITDTFSNDDNGELIAASLFSIGDILNKRLNDPAAAREAFERIIRQFHDTSWVGRAEQEIAKIKPADNNRNPRGSDVSSAISGLGLGTDTMGLGMSQSGTGHQPRRVVPNSRGGNYTDPTSGIGFNADSSRWILDSSMPHPGFLVMLKPRDGGNDGFPNVTLTVNQLNGNMTSAEYADKIKSDARSLLPMYKVVAEQDLQIAGQTVHEVFSYYVQNNTDILHKQSYIILSDKVYTLTCADLKNSFLSNLEAFKSLTDSITINGY